MSGIKSPVVLLYDAVGTPLAVQDGIAIPVGTPGLIIAGKDAGGASRFMRTATDGTVRIDPTGSTAQPVTAAQLPAALVGGRLDENVGAWLGSTAPTVGQKAMAASLPVALASDQTLEVGGLTVDSYAGYSPDPNSPPGDPTTLHTDPSDNLMVRGQVLTDEGSFRDDFSGSSLETSLTGTLTFNGTTTVMGVGTAFLSELNTDSYIRRSTDPNTALALVAQVISDTELELAVPYAGTSGSGAGVSYRWIPEIPVGGSISVAGSVASLVQNTTNGSIVCVQREGDYLPFTMLATLSVSQRIANQQTIIGFQDTPHAPEEQAVFVFDGTDNTKVKCRSSWASDSIQETTVSIPSSGLSSSYQVYEIDQQADRVRFRINGIEVALHATHLPGPYTPMQQVAYIENTGTPGSATTLSIDAIYFQNRDVLSLDEAVSIEGVPGGQPITIQFGNPGGGTALPKLIDVNFNKSEGALVASVYKRVASYTVPAGYNGFLIKFISFQGEVASSRVVAETNLGTHNDNTNVFTAGTPYTVPQWAAVVQAEVTTAFASGSGNVVLTVGYTNESGTAGRTGTITIPKGSVIGSRWDLVLQAGDLGLRSIQSVSGTPTQVGIVKILGLLQLALHQDQSTTTQTETLYAPGAITFPPGTVLGIEYAGGTVSKQRLLNALIQLVQ